MSPAPPKPTDTLERLADLFIEAKKLLMENGTGGLETIGSLVDLMLIEVAVALDKAARSEDPDRDADP